MVNLLPKPVTMQCCVEVVKIPPEVTHVLAASEEKPASINLTERKGQMLCLFIHLRVLKSCSP